jgi:MFS family permease
MVASATLAYFIADGIVLPVAPRYAEGPLDSDPVGVGISIGAFSLSALVLRPWVGQLADRRGRRLLMIVGPAIFALGMLGHLVATSMALFVVARLVLGAAEAFFFVGALTAISDLAPEHRRGEAISFFSLSLYLGVGIGPLFGEAVLGRDERFAVVWLAAAGVAALAAILAIFVPETRATAPDEPEPRLTRSGLIHPAGLLPGLVLLCGGTAMAGYFAFLPLQALALGDDGARVHLAVFAGVVVLLRLLGARLPDRLGARRLSTGAMVVAAVGLALIAAWGASLGLLVGSAVFALGVAFTFPALSTLAVSGVPANERGAVIGTFSAFLDLGFGVGPIAFGAAAALGGYPTAFLAGAVIAAAGAALLLARGRAPAEPAHDEAGSAPAIAYDR